MFCSREPLSLSLSLSRSVGRSDQLMDFNSCTVPDKSKCTVELNSSCETVTEPG